MVEVAGIPFAAVAFEIEIAGFPVFFDVHEGTVIFPAGSPLEVSANLASLHILSLNYYIL